MGYVPPTAILTNSSREAIAQTGGPRFLFLMNGRHTGYRACEKIASEVVRTFRLRIKLPPSQMLRRTAVALAEAGRRTAVALAKAVRSARHGRPEGLHYCDFFTRLYGCSRSTDRLMVD